MLAPPLKGRPITKLTELRTSQRKIKGWLSSKQWEHIIMETPNNAFYIMNYLMFLLVVQIGSLFVSLPHALDSSWIFYFIFYFFLGGGGRNYIYSCTWFLMNVWSNYNTSYEVWVSFKLTFYIFNFVLSTLELLIITKFIILCYFFSIITYGNLSHIL